MRKWRIEWPTVALAAAVYGSWLLATYYFFAAPWPLTAATAAVATALHTSLQHEILHGHPTSSRLANTILATPSPVLWLPYGVYRDSHLRHHRDERLTDPLDDPESYYVTPEQWERMGPVERRLRELANSFLGRMVIGPPFVIARFWRRQAAAILAGDARDLRSLAWHAAGLAPILAWVIWVCGIPLWFYVGTVVLPATALMLVRSFLEHQARDTVDHRTVIVEAGWFWRLLFLNNNYHALHHKRPAAPWYELPALWKRERERILEANGGYRYDGYGQIARRYLLRPKEPPIHPGYDPERGVTSL